MTAVRLNSGKVPRFLSGMTQIEVDRLIASVLLGKVRAHLIKNFSRKS